MINRDVKELSVINNLLTCQCQGQIVTLVIRYHRTPL